MQLKVHVFGSQVSFASSDASGFQRVVFLDAVLGRLTYPYLADKSVKPGLLASWSFSDDHKSLRLVLDTAHRFHNGRPILASDLEYSFIYPARSLYETPERSGFKNVRGYLQIEPGSEFRADMAEGIKVIDEKTLEICFLEPEPDFLSSIRMPAYSLIAKECMGKAGAQLTAANRNSGSHLSWEGMPVGAGPYRVASIDEPLGSALLVQHDYWRQKLSVQNILMTTGECPDDSDLVIGSASNPLPKRLVKKELALPWVIFGIFFKYDHPLVQDDRFRRAVLHALDREKIVKARGHGLSTEAVMPSNWPQWSPAKNRFDLNSAKGLFEICLSDYSIGQLAMTVSPALVKRESIDWVHEIEAQLQNAGCPIKLYETGVVPEGVPVCFNMSGFIPSVSSISTLFALFQEGSGWVSKLNQKDDVYSDLITKCRQQLRDNKDIADKLNQRFIEQAYAIPFFEEPVSCFVNEKVIASMNDDFQDISLMLQPIKLR